MKEPKVSVIVTTHADRGPRCKRAVKSVLKQTYRDFEVIVVDDGSTDNTEELITGLNNKRVRYIKREKNSGGYQGVAKNVGIKAARGEYIAYLDSDNTYRTGHLAMLADCLDKFPFIDLAYGDRLVYDEENERVLDAVKSDFDPSGLLNANYVDVSDAMHRKEIVYYVGGWDEKIKRMADWDLFARMVKAGAIFNRVPMILTDYILHKGSISNTTPIKGLEFSPYGSEINAGYLRPKQDPKVAIFTITKDRLDYTKRTFESMHKTTEYPFDHFVIDNGSTDGTVEWIEKNDKGWITGGHNNEKNVGISKASNQALDLIQNKEMHGNEYDIIAKVDNDCEFMTEGWLEDIVDIFQRNEKFILSPYVEGLRDNPGGAPRSGYGYVCPEDEKHYLGITNHIGGICCAAHKKAYLDFDEATLGFRPWRWKEKSFLHGNQDVEFSVHCQEMAIQPAYLEAHRVEHMDTTAGQEEKMPEYFELRKEEKRTKYEGE